MWQYTPPTDPHNVNQPNYSWPSDSSSGFSHLWPGVFHISFTDTQSTTREGRRKEQTNKHGLGSAPSARGGKFVPFCVSCELTLACTRAKTLTKPLAILTSLLCPAFISVDCLLCSLLLTVSFSYFSSDWSLGPSFRSYGSSRAQAFCMGFAPKTD